MDNARALVTLHDAASREATFNARFHAFADYLLLPRMPSVAKFDRIVPAMWLDGELAMVA